MYMISVLYFRVHAPCRRKQNDNAQTTTKHESKQQCQCQRRTTQLSVQQDFQLINNLWCW